MANVLPEVRPEVRSMPFEGFVMQTDGSARRSFIKNVNDEYFVRGVPGHTHNASAMISVHADYSKQRGAANTINHVWAPQTIHLGVNDYVDSVEPDNLDERTDRAIEPGIGNIVLIPENCQHIIDEPARSVSEIRTIVTPRDRLETLTYVDNLYGYVDPVDGERRLFNQLEPVMINFYGYQQPYVRSDAGDRPVLSGSPVTIGSHYEYVRYIVSSQGTDDKYAQDPKWDGWVPFYWDDTSHTYKSRPFSKYFEAVRIVTQNATNNNESNDNLERNDTPVVGTLKTYQPGAGTWDAAAGQWTGVTAMAADPAVQNVVVNQAGFPIDGPAFWGPLIPPDQFRVNFPAYETTTPSDGYCMFVGLNHEDSHFILDGTNQIDLAHKIVPYMPVDLIYAGNEMLSDPSWFGPPAYRIPVGGTHAIPGPPARSTSIKGSTKTKNGMSQTTSTSIQGTGVPLDMWTTSSNRTLRRLRRLRVWER